jgi:hypothetical protein
VRLQLGRARARMQALLQAPRAETHWRPPPATRRPRPAEPDAARPAPPAARPFLSPMCLLAWSFPYRLAGPSAVCSVTSMRRRPFLLLRCCRAGGTTNEDRGAAGLGGWRAAGAGGAETQPRTKADRRPCRGRSAAMRQLGIGPGGRARGLANAAPHWPPAPAAPPVAGGFPRPSAAPPAEVSRRRPARRRRGAFTPASPARPLTHWRVRFTPHPHTQHTPTTPQTPSCRVSTPGARRLRPPAKRAG